MTYGNLALKPEFETPKTSKKRKNNTDKIKRDNTSMLYKRLTMIRIAYILIIAISASFMISKFVMVYETQQQIKSLKSELSTMQANTSQKIFEMEQSIDMAKIESEATTRLGMQRPEKYQIIYVDVKQEDVTDVTANQVEGFKNNISRKFDTLKKNIIEFFSIN